MYSNNTLIPFLKKIKELINERQVQHKEKVLRGESFNIFSLLGVSSSEVRLHSAILGELLNPKGYHGAGSDYLKAFILNIIPRWKNLFSNEEIDKASVSLEFNIGEKSEDAGGRIDILVVLGGRAIIIENKIYAGDQDAQLLRYHNYGEKYDSHELLYLTLDGHSPAEYSTGNRLMKDTDFKCISYQEDIYTWISRCVELSHSRPYVRETLNQYLNTIKFLTDNIMSDINEIKKIAIDHIDEVMEIYKSLSAIANELIGKHILLPLQNFANNNDYEFIRPDDDPYYIGFKKPDEDFEIAIICDASRIKAWYRLYIAVHSRCGIPSEQFKRFTLNSLDKPFTRYLPYGWEWLDVHDWTYPMNFKRINEYEVYDWIIKKVQTIREEIDSRHIPMKCQSWE